MNNNKSNFNQLIRVRVLLLLYFLLIIYYYYYIIITLLNFFFSSMLSDHLSVKNIIKYLLSS